MKNDAICVMTHRQIASGICPWCGKTVGGETATGNDGSAPIKQTRWKIATVIQDLANVDSCLLAAVNLENLDWTMDEAPFAFEVALKSENRIVRAMATHELLAKGRDLTLPEATKYEESIREGLNELSLRIVLLTFYGKMRFSIRHYEKDWRRHALWLIINAPDLEIPKGSIRLDPERDGDSFVQAKEFWLDRLRKNAGNVEIIGQAVDFFGTNDFDKSEELLTTAKELDPTNAKWFRKLGELLMLKVINKSSDEQKEIGLRSIAELEEASRKSADDQERRYLASLLSQVPLKIGELEKARSYATHVLDKPYDSDGSLDQRCRHEANTILGIIALRCSDKEGATSYLHAAGNLVGETCPPLLTLARQLLVAGAHEAVIDYLRVCAPYINRQGHEAEQWIYEIENGKFPDFGPNLEYLAGTEST